MTDAAEKEISVNEAMPATVIVNGDAVETAARDLAALVSAQGFEQAAVATALDGAFVPRAARAATPLAPGARVEIVSAREGG